MSFGFILFLFVTIEVTIEYNKFDFRLKNQVRERFICVKFIQIPDSKHR